jgi:hypothetical protein
MRNHDNHDKKENLKLSTEEYAEYRQLEQQMENAETPVMVQRYSQSIKRLLLEVQARQKKSFATLATEDPKESVKLPVDDYNKIARLKQEMEFAETPWQVRRQSREIKRLMREGKACQDTDETSRS